MGLTAWTLTLLLVALAAPWRQVVEGVEGWTCVSAAAHWVSMVFVVLLAVAAAC